MFFKFVLFIYSLSSVAWSQDIVVSPITPREVTAVQRLKIQMPVSYLYKNGPIAIPDAKSMLKSGVCKLSDPTFSFYNVKNIEEFHQSTLAEQRKTGQTRFLYDVKRKIECNLTLSTYTLPDHLSEIKHITRISTNPPFNTRVNFKVSDTGDIQGLELKYHLNVGLGWYQNEAGQDTGRPIDENTMNRRVLEYLEKSLRNFSENLNKENSSVEFEVWTKEILSHSK